MEEGPAEIYKRSRKVFFDSLMDGIGKSGAAVDYHFALLNLQRHDGVITMDYIDQMLQKMVEPVLKQEEFADFWAQQEEAIRQAQIQAYFEASNWKEVERQEREKAMQETTQPRQRSNLPWTDLQHFQYRPVRDEEGNLVSDPVNVNQLGSGDPAFLNYRAPYYDDQGNYIVPQPSAAEEPPLSREDLGESEESGAPMEGSMRRDAMRGSFMFDDLHAGGIFGVERPEGTMDDEYAWFQRVVSEGGGRGTWPRTLSSQAAGLDEDQGMETINPFGKLSPLWGEYDLDDPIPGTEPPWMERLDSYYIRPEGGGLSPAEIDHYKDRLWEEYHRNHPDWDVGHPLVYDKDPNKTNQYLGESDQTPWDIYNHHYQNWHDDPAQQETISMYDGLYDDPQTRDRLLRRKHMDEAKKNWLRIGEFDEEGHPIGLGINEFFTGQEFLTPPQRTAVYEHIKENGTDAFGKKRQQVTDANHFEMGRLKRNLWSRFEPIHESFSRGVDENGPNGKQRSKGIKKEKATPWHIRQALKSRGLDSALITQFHTALGEESSGYGLPKVSKKYNLSSREAGTDDTLDQHSLLAMAGIDPESVGVGETAFDNMEHYPAGQHPFYPNWDPANSPIAHLGERGMLAEIKQVMKEAGNHSDSNYNARHVQNGAQWWTGQRVDPEDKHHRNYAINPNGEAETSNMSTHWGKMAAVKGGFGRNGNIPLSILHHHSGEGATKGPTEVIGNDGEPIMSNEIHSLLGVSDFMTPKSRAQHLIQQYGTGTMTSNFNIGQKVIGLWAPFTPVGSIDPVSGAGSTASERRRLPKIETERMDAGGGNIRQAAGEKLGPLVFTPTDAQETLNPWNMSFSAGVSGAKIGHERRSTHFSGPAFNHALKQLSDATVFMDSEKRKKHHRFLTLGRIQGRDSHAGAKNKFTSRYTASGASKEEDDSDHITKKGFAQHGSLSTH